jgi:hypothetical protein
MSLRSVLLSLPPQAKDRGARMEPTKRTANARDFIREGMLLFSIEPWFEKTIQHMPYKTS